MQSGADRIRAGSAEIERLNQRNCDTPECLMNDLRHADAVFDAVALRRDIRASALGGASRMITEPCCDREGNPIGREALLTIPQNIDGIAAQETEAVRYGICVRRSDMRRLPGDIFATDEPGDLNLNRYQLTGVRVNEPLLIRAVSKDRDYYYCDSDCCSGWIPVRDVAVCASREQWLEVWDIPSAEALVITEGKLYLENTNVNPQTDQVLLTLGTVLRRISPEAYDPLVTGRSAVHNYPFWLPVRQADGSCAQVQALISQNHSVSEGYLPLTTANILRVAFSMLGETYGWGGMLHSEDCSGYVRAVYRCFGLDLPRDTGPQSMMRVFRYDISAMTPAEKRAVLDTLPAGAILFFSGHEMLYLGSFSGKHYVISAVSSMRAFDSGERLRIRSVAINTLDAARLNGATWMESLETALLPYQAEQPPLPAGTAP